jgi:predicted DNA-binding WGR domain protein
MRRRFERTAGQSRQFWDIERTGEIVIVQHGDIGAAVQTTRTPLASTAVAQQKLEKLVAEKIREGYVEVTTTAPMYSRESLNILRANFAQSPDSVEALALARALEEAGLLEEALDTVLSRHWSGEVGDARDLRLANELNQMRARIQARLGRMPAEAPPFPAGASARWSALNEERYDAMVMDMTDRGLEPIDRIRWIGTEWDVAQPQPASWPVDERTDFAAIAHDNLHGGGGLGGLPADCSPLDAVVRFYDDLRGTPHADRLSEGISACMTDPNPYVRFQALIFFENHPEAAGAARVEEIVTGDRSLFDGVMEQGYDLGFSLRRALGARARIGITHAVDLAKIEILRPGMASGVIAGLSVHEPDWMIQHAEEIVRATPTVLGTLLYRVHAVGRDVGEVGERLARANLVPAAEFRVAVGKSVRDAECSQRIIRALASLQ